MDLISSTFAEELIPTDRSFEFKFLPLKKKVEKSNHYNKEKQNFEKKEYWLYKLGTQ